MLFESMPYICNTILCLSHTHFFISTAVVGVFLLVALVTPSVKTLPNNSLTLTAFTLLLAPINSSWRDTSGNTTNPLWLSFQLPTIVIDVATKPPLWKWMILWMLAVKNLFMIMYNSRSLILLPGMRVGIRVLEHLITFCNFLITMDHEGADAREEQMLLLRLWIY